MTQKVMKAAVLTVPEQIEIKQMEVPEVEPGMLELQISFHWISCSMLLKG